MTPISTERLPGTLELLREGIDQGLHLGGQLYVSLRGEPVADTAFGDVRPEEPMRADHLMLWLSASKPITVVALARLWEEGRLGLDDPVAAHLPAFAAGGKENVTIRHLLTHTGGIRMFETGWPEAEWDDILRRICARRLEPRWVPGRRAGYHEASSWFVLGEILARLAGRPFSESVRRLVFEPLGLDDSWIGMPTARFREYGERLAPVWNMERQPPVSHGWESEIRTTRPSPGGNGRGPIRELGRFYEALLNGGEELLSTPTVEALTARHRVGMPDRTFKRRLDWGLGFIVDSKHYDEPDLPYGYGPHASPRTFGHSGYRSVCAFADPEHGLVTALALNGTPDERSHQHRIDAAMRSIYEELDIAPEPENGPNE